MYIVAGLMKDSHQARGLVRALADAAFEREEIDMSGGPVQGLVNCGVPEGEAHVFAEGVRRGGVVVAEIWAEGVLSLNEESRATT